MKTNDLLEKQHAAIAPDIDQIDSLGTQIQWHSIEDGEAGRVMLLPETDGPPIHLHPSQKEEFIIRKGELMVYKQNKWITLKAGDSIDIPPRTPHTYKNASAEKVIFDFCLTPRGRFRYMLEAMDGYVQQQKIKGTDFRSVTYMCRAMNDFPDVTQSVRPPQFVVKLLAGINRLFFN